MPKCPHCKEEINNLLVYSSVCQTMELDKKGNSKIWGLDYCEGYDRFDCPECHEKIAESEGLLAVHVVCHGTDLLTLFQSGEFWPL